jgi:peroxiredoxin
MMRLFHAKLDKPPVLFPAPNFVVMRPVIVVSLLTFLLFSCGEAPLSGIPLRDLDGQPGLINPAEHSFTIVLFLSPECPLCLNYARNLRQLEEEFPSEKVKLVGVFSGKWFTAEEVREYRVRHGLGFTMLFDDELAVARKLQATVTPESFLLDSTGHVLYSGAIDNWVNDLGKKKLEVTEHYLRDAIISSLNGEKVRVKKTKAVGCLIE